MWLPTPIYERIPQFWFLLGLAFFAFGLYLGFEYQLIFAYLAVGVGCIARSAWILVMRSRYRKMPIVEIDAPAEKTVSTDENSEEAEHHGEPAGSVG